MGYRIQKLGIGGVLDQAISLLRDNIGLLFQVMAFLYIPFQLAVSLYFTSIAPQLPPSPTQEDLIRFQQATVANLPVVMPFGLFSLVVVLPITNAAIIHAIAEIYLGRKVTALQSIQFGLSRLGPMLLTIFLTFLVIFGGILLFIVPGILFAIWLGLAQHVTVVEKISGINALGRSRKLVRSSMGTFIILGIVGLAVGISLGVVAGMLGQNYLSTVVGVFVQAIATLFGSAMMTVYYFSCRCIVDNFDLEQLALAVEGSAAAN